MKPQQQKTRLRTATGSIADHAELVQAIQLDTIAAVMAAGPEAVGVHLVGTLAVGGLAVDGEVHLHADPGRGLNGALSEVAADLAVQWPTDAVIALMADLPALRPKELADVLHHAALYDRGVVLDAAGTGTTMLAARAGQLLAPSFGPGSAAAHLGSGAVALPAGIGARCDVDTAEDLRRCLQLGVGEHTARMVAHLI